MKRSEINIWRAWNYFENKKTKKNVNFSVKIFPWIILQYAWIKYILEFSNIYFNNINLIVI